MWFRPGVGVEPRLVRLKGSPIDEAGVMVWDENCPLIHGQMTHPLPDDTLFIYVAFAPSLAVGVSASIHRIGKDVVECGVSRDDPADRAKLACRSILQWKRQALGTEPEPDPARLTELGEAFEDRPDGAGDGLIRMKQDFPILFSPNQANGQTAAQFPASRLVADATVETSTDEM